MKSSDGSKRRKTIRYSSKRKQEALFRRKLLDRLRELLALKVPNYQGKDRYLDLMGLTKDQLVEHYKEACKEIGHSWQELCVHWTVQFVVPPSETAQDAFCSVLNLVPTRSSGKVVLPHQAKRSALYEGLRIVIERARRDALLVITSTAVKTPAIPLENALIRAISAPETPKTREIIREILESHGARLTQDARYRFYAGLLLAA